MREFKHRIVKEYRSFLVLDEEQSEKTYRYGKMEYWFKIPEDLLTKDIQWVLEPKLDGSNIRFHVTNLGRIQLATRRKEIAHEDFYMMFLEGIKFWLEHEEYDLTLVDVLLSMVTELLDMNLVFFGELYGSKNTPCGIHKEEFFPYNYSVFELYDKERQTFVFPFFLYEFVKDVLFPFEQVIFYFRRFITVNSLEELISEIADYWKFLKQANLKAEGIVLKAYLFNSEEFDSRWSCDIERFKWKPFDLRIALALTEIKNELWKHRNLTEGCLKGDKKQCRKLKKLIEGELNKHGFTDIRVDWNIIAMVNALDYEDLGIVVKYFGGE